VGLLHFLANGAIEHVHLLLHKMDNGAWCCGGDEHTVPYIGDDIMHQIEVTISWQKTVEQRRWDHNAMIVGNQRETMPYQWF
jgi:hypothetical protein